MRLRDCLLALIVLPLTCMAAGSGKKELARCLSGPVKDCDYTLIARAYDNIVPETVAKPNSEQEGLEIFVTCLILKGPGRKSYSDDYSLRMAVEALRQGVCKGDIENFTYKKAD